MGSKGTFVRSESEGKRDIKRLGSQGESRSWKFVPRTIIKSRLIKGVLRILERLDNLRGESKGVG